MPTKRVRKIISRTALSLLCVWTILPIGQAVAVNWGPASAYYDGTERATGYGQFYNSRNQRAVTKYVLSDVKKDGMNVYGHTTGNIYGNREGDSSNKEGGYEAGSESTAEISNVTRTMFTSFNLQPQGKAAQGDIQVCIQVGWPIIDECSVSSIPSFNY